MKQVIIIRSDLKNTKGEKIRTGKVAAQCCHASLDAILNLGKFDSKESNVYTSLMSNDIREWIETDYKKIVVSCNSEQELFDLYEKAKQQNLPCSIILDNGLTEFKEKTYTTVAIGPAPDAVLNNITGHLKLL